MAEEVTERVSRYIHDGSDQDLRRLLRIAEGNAEAARAAFRRVGVQHGWNAIDCGCGPIGGLVVLAEMVGPAGRVVGVDVSPAAVQRARAVVAALELGNVEVIAGDLHDLGAAALGGPFDLAFTRNFLTHQADPVRTLRRIADLLRPGGWLVAQEPLPSPPPRSHPHLEAVTGAWDLWRELLHRAGVPAGAVEDLPRSARQAGFEVTATYGSFLIWTRSWGSRITQPPSRRPENAASNWASRPRGSMAWCETSRPRRTAGMSGQHPRSTSAWLCASPLPGDSRTGVPYQVASCRSRVDDAASYGSAEPCPPRRAASAWAVRPAEPPRSPN